MERITSRFQVCQDLDSVPPMFGIHGPDGTHAPRISTDYQEVYRLAQICNRLELSTLHLLDVVTDFRRS